MTSAGVPNVKNETPTWGGMLEALVNAQLLKMFTCMPGVVQSYNKTLGTVSVQPSIKRKYIKDDETVDLPIINDVPVAFPRANDAAITFPIKRGDTVLLLFSQRSLERWKGAGGVVEAADPRHHALSDAIAIPGVYPKTKPIVGVDGENLVIRHGISSKITVKKTEVEVAVGAGKLTVNNTGQVTLGNGTIELLDLIDKLIDAVTKLTVPTGVGPSGVPINSPEFLALKTQLGLIKG